MRDLDYAEARDLEAAARALKTGGTEYAVLAVIERIDARRFAEETVRVGTYITNAIETYFDAEAQRQTEAATIVPTGPQKRVSGYGYNSVYEGGCLGSGYTCSRAGKYPAPIRVNAEGKPARGGIDPALGWAFVPSCKQHQSKAIEGYGWLLWRQAADARFGKTGEKTPLSDLVAWARELGVDLKWQEPDLKARGL